MNKVFNRLQTLKSSEDCKTFSKRFLHKNLIGGTATTGRKYVQNQWLSKVNADKPLTAVGTLTSLQRNSAKVMENLLKMPLVFKKVCESERMGKFVAVSMLVAVLSTSYVSESWAVNCATGKKVCQTGCIDESLTCKSCGPTCGYTQVGGEVTLYGTGEVSSGYEFDYDRWGYYDSNGNQPPFYKNKSITSVKADESSNFTSIGHDAFGTATSLESVDMPNVITIGEQAFYGASSLESVNMPNLTSIGNTAFYEASKLTGITITDALDSIGNNAFSGGLSFNDINCVESENTRTCEQVKSLMRSRNVVFSDDSFHTVTEPTENCSGYSQGACSSCKSGYTLFNSTCVATSNQLDDDLINDDLLDDYSDLEGCPEGKIAKGDSCIPAAQGCGENWRQIETWCNRIRYTPAEAAKVLKDDNTNEVTITFRK